MMVPALAEQLAEGQAVVQGPVGAALAALCFVSEADRSPGHYARQNGNRTAEVVYNHVRCSPMLLWLIEAAGLPRSMVLAAKREILECTLSQGGQSAAVRKRVPWASVDALLSEDDVR